MSDEADASDSKVEAFSAMGVEAARRALRRPQLLPIGVCHWCESPVSPRQLFCPVDEIEPDQSCSVLWEHHRQRVKANGL